MKPNNYSLPLPSVSSIPFPIIPPQNVPPGMVPQVVGYMTTGANPQFLPLSCFQPPQNQSIINSQSIIESPSISSSENNSTISKKPATTKANELKDKQPCKHWDKCTKTNYRDHKEHGEKYYHPCKRGVSCENVKDPVHRSRFVHPCKSGTKCTKLQQKEHCLHYTHNCSEGTACQKYLSGDISHCHQFTHETNHHNTKNTAVDVFPWPKEWENAPKLSKNPLQKPHFKMVSLSTSSKEYQHVSQLFQSTSSGRTISKIERIENYVRWNWFSLQKQNMKANHNEKQLFHGTQQQFAELIAKEGFDARVSNSGKFGNGIYFSPNASYSLGYAGSGGRMFIVRVLVGNSYSAQTLMTSIKKAPQGYDSVVGCGGQEIIVYDNKQAYPEYMITYH